VSGNLIILTVLFYGGNLVTTDVITVGDANEPIKEA
jgi:hypothetical protein